MSIDHYCYHTMIEYLKSEKYNSIIDYLSDVRLQTQHGVVMSAADWLNDRLGGDEVALDWKLPFGKHEGERLGVVSIPYIENTLLTMPSQRWVRILTRIVDNSLFHVAFRSISRIANVTLSQVAMDAMRHANDEGTRLFAIHKANLELSKQRYNPY